MIIPDLATNLSLHVSPPGSTDHTNMCAQGKRADYSLGFLLRIRVLRFYSTNKYGMAFFPDVRALVRAIGRVRPLSPCPTSVCPCHFVVTCAPEAAADAQRLII